MEPQNLASKESFSLTITIINLVGGALTGIVTAVWYFSGMKSRLENSEEKLKNLNNVIFRDKGGLTFLTPEAHAVICLANQEGFGKDLELISQDIAHMRQTLSRIESNAGIDELAEMRKLMASINIKIEDLQEMESGRRVPKVRRVPK